MHCSRERVLWGSFYHCYATDVNNYLGGNRLIGCVTCPKIRKLAVNKREIVKFIVRELTNSVSMLHSAVKIDYVFLGKSI